MEFKDELKVTKSEAKHIEYDNNCDTVEGVLLNDYTLHIQTIRFRFDTYRWGGKYNLTEDEVYKNFKWILTNKLHRGNVVKHIDYKIDSKLYVYDSHCKQYNMSNCWGICNNRPKEILGDEYMYKLVRRE